MKFITHNYSIRNFPQLNRFLRFLARFEQFRDVDGNVLLSFVSSDYIRSINKQFRNVDSSTDVLAFKLDWNFILGELYLSLEDIERYARKYKNSIFIELCTNIVHGTLHLLGYEHSDMMFNLQSRIIEIWLENVLK